MNPLGICVIGAGHMGRIHAECWTTLPDVRIVAVVDPDRELGARLADKYGAALFDDVENAISHPEVNVVSICTPTALHPAFAIFAAHQGKHVLCEKPIALTLAEAQGMKQAAYHAGTHLMIGLMRRHSALMVELLAWLDEGHLGRPLLAHTVNIMPLRPKRAMHDAHANGGPLIDMLVHFVDTWSILFRSEPVSVVAEGMVMAEGRPELAHIAKLAVDTAVLIIRFASGDIGNVFLSWGTPPDTDLKVHDELFVGPGGLLTVRFAMAHQIASWQGASGERTLIFETNESMYQRQIDHFAYQIRHGPPNTESVDAAIRGLRVSLAAIESLRTHQIVPLQS